MLDVAQVLTFCFGFSRFAFGFFSWPEVSCFSSLIWMWVSQEELKSTTIKMAEQSKVLNTPGAEKQTKRELFDALRQELE